jgi:hypothetical protein
MANKEKHAVQKLSGGSTGRRFQKEAPRGRRLPRKKSSTLQGMSGNPLLGLTRDGEQSLKVIETDQRFRKAFLRPSSSLFRLSGPNENQELEKI